MNCRFVLGLSFLLAFTLFSSSGAFFLKQLKDLSEGSSGSYGGTYEEPYGGNLGGSYRQKPFGGNLGSSYLRKPFGGPYYGDRYQDSQYKDTFEGPYRGGYGPYNRDRYQDSQYQDTFGGPYRRR